MQFLWSIILISTRVLSSYLLELRPSSTPISMPSVWIAIRSYPVVGRGRWVTPVRSWVWFNQPTDIGLPLPPPPWCCCWCSYFPWQCWSYRLVSCCSGSVGQQHRNVFALWWQFWVVPTRTPGRTCLCLASTFPVQWNGRPSTPTQGRWLLGIYWSERRSWWSLWIGVGLSQPHLFSSQSILGRIGIVFVVVSRGS